MKANKRKKIELHRRRVEAYNKWFCAQVQEALDDPRPSIPHEQVEADIAVQRAELLRRIETDLQR